MSVLLAVAYQKGSQHAPTPEPVPSETVEAIPGEGAFLDALRKNSDYGTYSDQELITLGKQSCALLAIEEPLPDVIARISEEGFSQYDSGYLIAAAAMHLCPQELEE